MGVPKRTEYRKGRELKKRWNPRKGTKIWIIVYSLLLIAASAFIMLDAFVIPGSIVSVSDTPASTADSGEKNSGAGEAVITDTSYSDAYRTITISTDRIEDTDLYIADVKITDPSLLRAGLAEGVFGRNVTEPTSVIAKANNAIFAINGDYYGFRSTGYVMRNGYLYRSVKASDTQQDLVVYGDGSVSIINESDITATQLEEAGAQQIFSFGPGLVIDGEISVDEDSEVERSQMTNPRTAFGIIEPLHYVMVVSDGRTTQSRGLSLLSLAKVMKNLGCTQAYNLDGGGSATMWFNGKVLNKPTTYGKVIEERSLSDILYIAD